MTAKLFQLIATVTATSGLAANTSQFSVSEKALSGFTVSYQAERDWNTFTDALGAPAECLLTKQRTAGLEQLWSGPKGKLRIDFATFNSAGEALSAAREAALMLNNATERADGASAIGDASWRTVVGSPTLIVQRGNVVFYVSSQSEGISAQQVANVARSLAGQAAKFQKSETAAQIACDLDTYVGLNLMKPNAEIKGMIEQLSSGSKAQLMPQIKRAVQALGASEIDPAARANLLRSLDNAQ